MVEEPGPAEGKRSVVGFYHCLQTKHPESADGRETGPLELLPSRQGTRQTRAVPLMACSLDFLDPNRVCPTDTEEGSCQEGETSGWER